MKQITALVLLCIVFMACNNKSDKDSSAGFTIADTLLSKVESNQELPAISDSTKMKILKRGGGYLSYSDYKNEFRDENNFSIRWQDIDADGRNEIITNYYTGGAHCCEGNTILSQTGKDTMQEILTYTGGIAVSNDTVLLNFEEALGYFHTCYACGKDYPKEIIPSVRFQFKAGKFSMLPTDAQINNDIEVNLRSLLAKPIPDKESEEESGFDDGTRKAIAFNLVAFYFNNQRNLTKTRELFQQYYTHRDKNIIWKDLTKYISGFDDDIRKGVLLN